MPDHILIDRIWGWYLLFTPRISREGIKCITALNSNGKMSKIYRRVDNELEKKNTLYMTERAMEVKKSVYSDNPPHISRLDLKINQIQTSL
jgi:hypothetical protein